MQQIPADGPEHQWQQGYRNYTADSSFEDNKAREQKISDESDEQFADMLVRKLKDQLEDDLRHSRDRALGYRLALAIVSICLLVPLLAILVAALALGLGSGGASITLGWSMIAVCATIIAVNAYFNASISGKHGAGTGGGDARQAKRK